MKITAEAIYGNTAEPISDVEMNPWTVTLTRDDTGSELSVPFWTGLGLTGDPTAADVLDCLLLDRDGYEQSEGFEDWATEYGYDTDSRKAFALYEKVKISAAQLDRFVGDLYETLDRPDGDLRHDDDGSVLIEEVDA